MDKIKLFKSRDIGDIIQDAFGIATKQAQPLWGNVLKILVPLYAAVMVIGLFWLNDLKSLKDDLEGIDQQEALTKILPLFLSVKPIFIVLLIAVSHLFIYGLTLNFMRLSQRGGDVSEDEVRSSAFSDMGWILGFQMLSGLIVGFATFLFFFPGIYWGVILSILLSVATIEKLSFGDAFERCRALVNDNWWNTFLIVVLIGLLSFMASVVINIIFTLIALIGGTVGEIANIAGGIIQYIISIFFTIINIIAITLQYYNLRIKHDGGAFDDGENSVINEIGGDEENTRMM